MLVYLFIRYFILHILYAYNYIFFILTLLLYFYLFVNHVNKPIVFVFGAFVYHFKNSISIFVTIFFSNKLFAKKNFRIFDGALSFRLCFSMLVIYYTNIWWTCIGTVSGGVIYLTVGKICFWCLYQSLVSPVTSALRIIDRYHSHPLF